MCDLSTLRVASFLLAALPCAPAAAQCVTDPIVPHDPSPPDFFGGAVSGDGDRVVVGAWGDNAGPLLNAGSVYVFEGGTGAWTEVQKLQASDPVQAARFGNYVDVSGDTIVVGAYDRSAPCTQCSTAYVFERGPSGFVEAAKLSAGEAGSFNGYEVALDGDVIVVGAPLEGSPGTAAGSAFVFERSGTTWVQTAELTGSDAGAGAWFGRWVDVCGDRIAVTASFGSGPLGPSVGAVYVFERSGSSWVEVAKLNASDAVAGDGFGRQLKLSHDTLVAAATAHEHGGAGPPRGAVYVFERRGAAWSEVAELTGAALGANLFGSLLDVDGDRILAGPFLFQRLGGIWQHTAEYPTLPVWVTYGSLHLEGDRAVVLDPFAAVETVAIHELDVPLGTSVCASNANSTGSAAGLTARGHGSVALNCLDLVAAPVPANRFGYYLMSRTQALVPLFGGSQGNLCLGLPLVRFSRHVLVSSPGEEMAFSPDFTALPQGTVFQPGETWTFQCWFRDVNPGVTSNTSSALAVTFSTSGAPSVQLPDALTDREEETVLFEIPVTLSQPTDVPVSVPYSHAGTATNNVDYRIEAANPLVIPAGRRSAPLVFVLAEDALQEGDETVTITLQTPAGASLGTSIEHTVTIRDDD